MFSNFYLGMRDSTIDYPDALLPIYTGKNLSLKKLGNFIGVTNHEMCQIIGQDVHTAQRNINSGMVVRQLSSLIYVLKMLWELTDKDSVVIRRWLREPLVEWRGIVPLECILNNRIGSVSQLVERMYLADSAGY